MKWYNIDWWKWMIVIPILMLILSIFCRCRSKQSIVAQTYITDKANEKKWDSLFNIRLVKELERFQASRSERKEKNIKDSTHIKDSVATRFDVNGKKIGEDKFHYEYRYMNEKEVQNLKDSISYYRAYLDSTKFYHARYDSLAREMSNTSEDKVYVEKDLSRWQKICLQTGQMVYILILAIVLVLIYTSYKKGS